MVIVCKDAFTQDELFNEHFEKFLFPLSDFQKYAIIIKSFCETINRTLVFFLSSKRT